MSARTLTPQANRSIGRPLKVLIPMIQSELQQGNDAGQEHYRMAGEMLLEAKEQVPYGGWGKWLRKNFDLSHDSARNYMLLATAHREFTSGARKEAPTTMRQMTGAAERQREDRRSQQQQEFKRILRDVGRDRDTFVQARQARDVEIQLHRKIAEELIDAGYRAMAIKLHPDRGGSKEAMARLNLVRDELKIIAKMKRFI